MDSGALDLLFPSPQVKRGNDLSRERRQKDEEARKRPRPSTGLCGVVGLLSYNMTIATMLHPMQVPVSNQTYHTRNPTARLAYTQY